MGTYSVTIEIYIKLFSKLFHFEEDKSMDLGM